MLNPLTDGVGLDGFCTFGIAIWMLVPLDMLMVWVKLISIELVPCSWHSLLPIPSVLMATVHELRVELAVVMVI
jgi:hypothetical protein